MVRREVVRLVTAGTLSEDSLDARRNNYLAALACLGTDAIPTGHWRGSICRPVARFVRRARKSLSGFWRASRPARLLLPDGAEPWPSSALEEICTTAGDGAAPCHARQHSGDGVVGP